MANYNHTTASIGSALGVAIFLIAMTISFLFSDQTYALTLTPVLDTLTPVANIVRRDDTDATNQRDENTAKSTPAPAAAKKSPQQPSSPSLAAPAAAIVTAEPLSQLPTIAPLDISQTADVRATSPLGTAMTTAAVLDTQTAISATPLQATDRGWEIFGIGWYWWLLGGMASYGLVRQIMFIRHRLSLNENTLAS